MVKETNFGVSPHEVTKFLGIFPQFSKLIPVRIIGSLFHIFNIWSGDKNMFRNDDDNPLNIPVKYFEPPRFNLDTERKEMLEYLDLHGYAVVASVVPTQQDIANAKDLYWKYMEAHTSIDRNNVETWQGENWLPDTNYGLMNHGTFAHSEYLWNLRMLPRVKQTFEAIWGEEDLLVSFDGGNAFRPWKYNPDWKTSGGWWHVDQGPAKGGKKNCVQGLINLYDATDSSGGLCVVPGTHRLHEKNFENGQDIESVDVFLRMLRSEKAILLGCKAGDFIVWDSRTIHCNTPALKNAEAEENNNSAWDLIRMVGYVCMTPASFASPEMIKKRLDLFKQSASTNHCPHDIGVVEVPKHVPEQKLNQFTVEQQNLIVGKSAQVS
jgi:hypothetical protein